MSNKTIIEMNFVVLVQKLEEAIKEGYSVVYEGEARPYSQIAGRFIVNLEKVAVKEEVKPQAQQVEQAVQKQNTRGRKAQ